MNQRVSTVEKIGQPVAYARGSEKRVLRSRDREGVGAFADFSSDRSSEVGKR
jgi:hypothetical protein